MSQSLLDSFRLCLEIFISKLNKKRIRYINRFIDIDIFSYILKMFENFCEAVIYNNLFTRDDNGNCEKIDILEVIFRREDALPDSERIEKVEILSIEQGDPSKAIEERIYFQLFQPAPN